jgi:uncharacterized protein YciI
MPLFLLTYHYHDTPLRAERRDDHLAHLNRLHAQGNLVVAGPFVDADGGAILLQAEDEPSARALVEQDPYTQLDVTTDRELRGWRPTVGTLAE